ncbi:prephenate dehydratase [Alkalihalobacillus sp. AL-G]|uniref:prephenate dehydratase n=1 Tax=Alkalihalobacillus sp. AL-G TaxID=2926399 RepID=UPI00272BF708|nr:prephenate dehydratase [Alkalihalobacillus sp. AL-G]WLD93059.1 prephenate dehydratase [Alkalihalobacillus sp. AL-G]
MKVAYLGPKGTFSEEAAIRYFSSQRVEWMICESILDVFDAIKDGKVVKGIVPIENSIEGTINITADGLLMNDLFIEGEVILPVALHLIGVEGTKVDHIHEVWSIPPALAQCRDYIRELGASSRHFNSTASAAMAVRDKGTENVGAIASEWSAKAFGLQIIKENVHDHTENHTRFVIVTNTPDQIPNSEKTMILITPHKERSGVLAIILNVFASLSINLTWIESRPTKKKLGTYRFFIETEKGVNNPDMEKAITILKTYGHHVQILGSYNVTEL